MPALSDLMTEDRSSKLAREMTHEQFTAPENPVGEAITQWGRGVAERSTPQGYLSALASEAQRYQQMPPGELAGQFGPSGGSGLVGMFAGRGAKTANLAQLARAEEMAKAGVPDPEIWKQTGWTLNTPDKLPRFEIPDNAARFKETPRENILNTMPTGRALQHDDLYAAYPDVWDTKMTFQPFGGGGRFDPITKSIHIETGDAPYPLSITGHELQHAIQQREGFARGGSPEQIGREVRESKFNVDDLSQKLERMENQAGDEAELWIDKYPEKVKDAIDYVKRQGLYDEGLSIKEMVRYAITDRDRSYQSITNQWKNAQQMSKTSPTAAYQRLAGEAEARLTQARMTMTPEQRLAKYPYEPEYFQQATGVPLQDLIVRQDGGTAMSVPAGYKNDIPKLISDVAESMRMYEAQKHIPVQKSNKLSDVLYGAGALGAGVGTGYYGTDYLLGE